ncbi:undecaprenyl pyrophosphate phosphatase [Marinomonas spartinae]|uniref:undecaprenyl-diphosphate phosphatase n=1 Tax=Marinomonas spartinae TaxID=1792290 RepID=A0A1A8TVU5_9GAMM|nr:phosphatase PAP2 family protein [Marinomonas spartinae]SBS37569.1 undecaprenyl pyrophosphate phosphatase [Marinomonas spartinae]
MADTQIPRYQWVLLAGLLLCFIALAVIANTAHIPEFDRRIFLALRDPMDSTKEWGPTWLAELMRDITALGSNWILLFFCFVYAVFLCLIQRPYLAKYLLLTVIVGMLVSLLLKLGFDRPRPSIIPHGVRVYTSSFPSGHGMSSSFVWLTLALVATWHTDNVKAKRFLVGVALLTTLMVSFSRVYLGVHWPTDVLAGMAVGLFWALLCYRLARYGQAHYCQDKSQF